MVLWASPVHRRRIWSRFRRLESPAAGGPRYDGVRRSVKETVVPLPGSVSHQIAPPCASTMRLAM